LKISFSGERRRSLSPEVEKSVQSSFGDALNYEGECFSGIYWRPTLTRIALD
jgi:hypothetical protein